MALEHMEQQLVGQTLAPLTRLVSGVLALVAGLAHLLLGAAAITFLYVLLFVA